LGLVARSDKNAQPRLGRGWGLWNGVNAQREFERAKATAKPWLNGVFKKKIRGRSLC